MQKKEKEKKLVFSAPLLHESVQETSKHLFIASIVCL